ncbi:MAG: MFS transporter [Candidatus Taylorbacteria bacterium]|nr:MFS transporter [Candidatus Taylorbacteria bacterium]
MKGIALTSIRYGMKDKAVRFLLLVTFAQVFAVQALNMYWQPFFKGHHICESNLGYVFAGIMASVAIGSLIIARMKCAGKEKTMILWVQIIAGVFVIISAVIASLPMIMTFFLLHEAMRGMDAPLKSGYLQKRIPSAERATISSFCAISPHIGGVFGLLLSDLIAQSFGISVAWIVSGSVLIVVPLLLMRNDSHASD